MIICFILIFYKGLLRSSVTMFIALETYSELKKGTMNSCLNHQSSFCLVQKSEKVFRVDIFLLNAIIISEGRKNAGNDS